MSTLINAICFDVGGTLRATIKDDSDKLNQIKELQRFIGHTGDPTSFWLEMRRREKKYRHWCKDTLVELSESEFWTRFMLPEMPQNFVRENAVKINQIWRSGRNNQIFPDAVETIKSLHEHGYKLAIISNTMSSTETPQMLEAYGLWQFFHPVILSCSFGRRKPHPSLFLEAARLMHIAPQNCAYVGDNLSRDLIGARQAGFGEVVIINKAGYVEDAYDPDDDLSDEIILEIKPDHRIGKLSKLIEIYALNNLTAKPSFQLQQPEKLFDIALSTMWSVDQHIPFSETFTEARKLGFKSFELTSKITPELYKQWDSNQFYVTTVHDPCPSDYGYSELKKMDIAISSIDEQKRKLSLDGLKRSIDLAVRLGSRSVVVHCGTVLCNHSLDIELRQMYQEGRKDSLEYQRLKDVLINERNRYKGAHLEKVLTSLKEIIAFSRGSKIMIALENRNRFYDIPLPEELEKFLGLCDEAWFGFQYDVGHAHNLDVLGFVNKYLWLDKFGSRMIGMHLHDVIGLKDHQVPGLGEVDFRKIAPYLKEGILRTLEVSPQAEIGQIASGLEFLHKAGCINKL